MRCDACNHLHHHHHFELTKAVQRMASREARDVVRGCESRLSTCPFFGDFVLCASVCFSTKEAESHSTALGTVQRDSRDEALQPQKKRKSKIKISTDLAWLARTQSARQPQICTQTACCSFAAFRLALSLLCDTESLHVRSQAPYHMSLNSSSIPSPSPSPLFQSCFAPLWRSLTTPTLSSSRSHLHPRPRRGFASTKHRFSRPLLDCDKGLDRELGLHFAAALPRHGPSSLP